MFLISALIGCEFSASLPGHYREKARGSLYRGGCMGTLADLEALGKRKARCWCVESKHISSVAKSLSWSLKLVSYSGSQRRLSEEGKYLDPDVIEASFLCRAAHDHTRASRTEVKNEWRHTGTSTHPNYFMFLRRNSIIFH